MSTTDKRPNFFVLLGLDPDAPWDPALFQRVLAQRRNEWSKQAQTGLPKEKAARARENLRWFKEIGPVMEDSGRREEEREKARTLATARTEALRKDVVAQVTLILAKGYVLDEELARIRRDHPEVLASDRELARQLDTAEIRSTGPDSAEIRLSPDLEDTIATLLAVVDELSIYEVLRSVDKAVTNNSTLEKLRAAADQLLLKTHGVKDKSDPKLAARERLCGIAKNVFSSDEQRRRHDMSMDIAKLRGIMRRFEVTLAVASAVSPAQVELYLEQARTAGVDDLELAKRLLVAEFGRRGWTVEMPAAEAEARLRRRVQCPRCAELNDPDSRACRTCELYLREPCPNCGAIDPRYGLGCRCGFPIGQRYLVQDLTLRAKQAIGEHNLEEAAVHLDRAATIWALPTDRPDALADDIRTARATLDEAQLTLHVASTSIERLMSERRYVAAAQEIRSAPDGLPRRDALLRRAEVETDKARDLCRQAQRPGTSRSQRADLYAKALRICHDMEVARTELSRMPPEPPRGPRATVSDPAAGVQLSWAASPDHDVSYVVINVTGDRPPEPADNLPGQRRVGTTTGTTFRDRGAAELSGVPLRYAVFTERSGTYSAPAVTEPVIVATEPTVDTRAEDGQVVLTWSMPNNALRVAVSRVEVGGGAPVALPVTDTGRLTDTAVRNGVRYRYTVRAAYQNPHGGVLWSAGRTQEVTPAKRPAPSGPLTVTGSSPDTGFAVHKAQIRWPPPDRGIMKVVRLRGAGLLREGDRFPESELDRDGRVLDGPPPVIDAWIEQDLTVCSYVPVVIVDGMGYVGPPRRYARADEPSGLHGEFVGDAIRVGWTWPDDAREVLVGYDAAAVLDPTVAPGQLTVGRVPGDRTGGCDIPPAAAHVYVVVATVVEQHGVRFVTSGVPLRITRPAARIQYEVRTSGLRRQELTLRAERPVELPALILRGRPDRPPETPEDGELVTFLAPMRLTGRHTVTLRPAAPDLRYRLFAAADNGSVRLDPA